MTAEEIRALCDIAGIRYMSESTDYGNLTIYRASIAGWKRIEFDEDLAWNSAWDAYVKLGALTYN